MAAGDLEVPAISCRNVGVEFGEVTALADVSIQFPAGRIHVVVGQNGAGKTTFARVVAGIVKPGSGTVAINGAQLEPGNVMSARSAGIELVHQGFALPPSFTVAEALEFGRGGGLGLFGRGALNRHCQERLDALGLEVDPRRRIGDLPIEQQQGVEIARALSSDAKILILDEPTAVLPPPGIERLFDRIRKLKQAGVTIILILHKSREVWSIADTISVLRDGRLVAGPLESSETDPERVGAMIMGVELQQSGPGNIAASPAAGRTGTGGNSSAATGSRGAGPVLMLDGVSTGESSGEHRLAGMSFAVNAGEIVGVAGVEGNGQGTLVRVLAGFSQAIEGNIEISGHPALRLGLAERRSLGMRIIPFDRSSEGLSVTSELWENWAAGGLAAKPMLSLINPSRLREHCRSSLAQWGVRFSSTSQQAGSLSGGNSQKLILARELDEAATAVVAAQPTRGLDIGATSFVWSTLRQVAQRGCGVLLISSDLDELFGVSKRILVVLSGRIVCELQPPYDLATAGRTMIGEVA